MQSKCPTSSFYLSAVWATSAGFTIAADEISQVRTISVFPLICHVLFFHYAFRSPPPLHHTRLQICAAAANPASIMGKNLQIAGGVSERVRVGLF